MADEKKSCEGKEVLLMRIQQDLNWNRINKQDLRKLIGDSKPTQKTVGEIKVDVDCSDALTGMKAIQREAKKATAALRELEEQQNIIRKETLVNYGVQVMDHNGEEILSKEDQKKTVRRILDGDQS